ncbi:MAG: hypothetical protein WCK17_03730 [Verrucomicrobiota bacterium]
MRKTLVPAAAEAEQCGSTTEQQQRGTGFRDDGDALGEDHGVTRGTTDLSLYLHEMESKTQLRYITLLEVKTPALMQEHIATILDAHAGNWMETAFSGDVNFQCWNDMLEPEHIEPVGDVLRQILAGAQNVIDSNNITTSDGNRVVLRASLSKYASEATDNP